MLDEEIKETALDAMVEIFVENKDDDNSEEAAADTNPNGEPTNEEDEFDNNLDNFEDPLDSEGQHLADDCLAVLEEMKDMGKKETEEDNASTGEDSANGS